MYLSIQFTVRPLFDAFRRRSGLDEWLAKNPKAICSLQAEPNFVTLIPKPFEINANMRFLN